MNPNLALSPETGGKVTLPFGGARSISREIPPKPDLAPIFPKKGQGSTRNSPKVLQSRRSDLAPFRGQGTKTPHMPPCPSLYRGARGLGSGKQTLYRFWSHNHELLYIGISSNLPQRITEHRQNKKWWTDIATITVEHFPDRASVSAAEKIAIQNERPLWNIAHNRHPRTAVTPDDMPDLCDTCETTHGEFVIYLPYRWVDGCGYYQCERSHSWTCWWGHSQSGEVLDQ